MTIFLFSIFRLSRHRLEKLRAEHGNIDHGETYKGYNTIFWSFSRQGLTQSITKLQDVDDQVAVQMFHIILTYAGLGQNGMRYYL